MKNGQLGWFALSRTGTRGPLVGGFGLELFCPIERFGEEFNDLLVGLLIEVEVEPADVGLGVVEPTARRRGNEVLPDLVNRLVKEGAPHGQRQLAPMLVVDLSSTSRSIEVFDLHIF